MTLKGVIRRPVKNIFTSGELAEESNMQKTHFSHSDKPNNSN